MATIACPSCAQPVDAAASYCPNCGNPIAAAAQQTAPLPTGTPSSGAPAASPPLPAPPSDPPPPRTPRPPRSPSPVERFVTDVELRPALLAAVAVGGYLFTKDVAGTFARQTLGIVLSIVFGLIAAGGAGLGTRDYASRRSGFLAGFVMLAVAALIANVGLLIAFISF